MPSTGGRGERHGQDGFTLIEVLVALTVLLIGVAGIMAMYTTSMKATAYTRHATEAVVLGEDKMEELLLIPLSTLEANCPAANPCSDTVAADGTAGGSGIQYTRTWQVSNVAGIAPPDPSVKNVSVSVSWEERGDNVQLDFRTQRVP